MKLTPFAKFFITVVILGVIGYALWYYKGSDIRKWAGADKGAAGTVAAKSAGGVSSDDFNALKSAPPDPERGKGAAGVSGAAMPGSGKLGRPLVVAINTWAGHALQADIRARREIRPPRGPGRQARGLPQGRRGHHVEHGGQLGARSLDPGRAEPEGEVHRDAGLVARGRRHRVAFDDQVHRGAEGPQDLVHAVHALALPAPLPPRAVGPSADDRAAVEKNIIFTQDAPAAAAMF